MIKYDISAYADYTTSWGEPCYVGVLSIKESQEGKWVMADAVDVFVDGQVSEARRLLTLEHIRETSDMRTKLHEMNMSGAADAEDYAKSEHYYATEIEKLKLQLETMTADRDAEKSMKATARIQRDAQVTVCNAWRNVAHKSEQTIIDLKYQLVNANEMIRRYMESV